VDLGAKGFLDTDGKIKGNGGLFLWGGRKGAFKDPFAFGGRNETGGEGAGKG